MTRIGDQCKGCSRAYWEGKQRKAPKSDVGSAVEAESPSEAGSRAPDVTECESTAFDDPERALQRAISRLAQIETQLSSSNLCSAGVASATISGLIDEHQEINQHSHDALREEQQMLKARVTAIFRSVGLFESHDKNSRLTYWDRLKVDKLVQKTYFRHFPYYRILLNLRRKLPGITDLLRFMDDVFSSEVSSLITVYENSGAAESHIVTHELKINDVMQLLSHWDILNNFNSGGDASRSVLLVDGLDAPAVEVLGNALRIHPLVFVRHLWRNFGRDFTQRRFKAEYEWEIPPLSQAPLCSQPDEPAHRIALDVGAHMSLKPFIGADLYDLQDLYSIETLGELHEIQERTLWGHKATSETVGMSLTLSAMRAKCAGREVRAESTRLETPIARCIIENPPPDHTSTILSTLELCASATICTIAPKSRPRSFGTLVLRTPSRWHETTIKESKGTATETEDAILSHDPFRTKGLWQRNDTETKGSIDEALCTVRDLEAAAKTELSQDKVSILISIFLLKAAASSIWNMTVSDHYMLLSRGKNYVQESTFAYSQDPKLIEVSDGCRAYLNDRCHRQRDAMQLSSAVAETLHLAVFGSASSALISQVEQELGHIKKIVSKIESQLLQTENLVSTRIDQSFRDLQITLAQIQLEESRKAIKQADTVARLTVLAFVFIPISAVCGFFGMNIIEVAAKGGFSFWVFGTTMGTVLAMTLLLAFADSVIAILYHYASKFDFMMYMNWNYPWRLLTYKVPYVFRWVSVKIGRRIASGQELRQRNAMIAKAEFQREGEA